MKQLLRIEYTFEYPNGTTSSHILDNNIDFATQAKQAIYDDNLLLSLKSMKNGTKCPVCFDKKRCKIGLFECQHKLCSECFKKLKNPVCPTCRAGKSKI